MATQMTSRFTATTAFEKLKDVTGHHTETHTLKVMCHLLTEKCKSKDKELEQANKNAKKWRDQAEELIKEVMKLKLENHKLILEVQKKENPTVNNEIKQRYQDFDYSSSDEEDY